MSKKIFWILNSLLLLAMVVGVVLLYPSLPEKMPIHWNYRGEIDGYASKSLGAWLLPVITLAMLILVTFLRRIDPRAQRFQDFEKAWSMVIMGVVGFMAYLHFVILYLVFHPSVSINPFMMLGIGALFMVIGNYLGKVRRNYTMGIRVPWTLDNEEVWNRTHRLGGWCFVVSGLAFMINAYFNWQVGWVFIGALSLAVVVPIVYSYIIFRQISAPKK